MDDNAGAQPHIVSGEAPQQSFAERKAAQLKEERGGAIPEAIPQPESAPSGTPDQVLESAEVAPEEGYPSEEEGGEYAEEASEAPEGNPEELFEEESAEPQTDWQQRFEDTQRKLSDVTENRKVMDQEHSDMMSANLKLRYDLEDGLKEAQHYAQAYKSGFDGQIAQLEQAFNQGMIEPDNLPGARQQYQALVEQRNQLNAQVEQLQDQERKAKEVKRERQAEMARLRLQRSIPNWSKEKYNELGSYAQSLGYSAEEFGESLDYRFLELLHDSMQLRTAGKTVEGIKRQRKTAAPQRSARQQSRSADGKYRKAKEDFRANPGQKGRFAAMKAAELAKERGR